MSYQSIPTKSLRDSLTDLEADYLNACSDPTADYQDYWRLFQKARTLTSDMAKAGHNSADRVDAEALKASISAKCNEHNGGQQAYRTPVGEPVGGADNRPTAAWINAKTGERVHTYAKGVPMSRPDTRGEFGQFIVGLATGNWSGNQSLQALSTGVNSAGGYLVPDHISSEVIDLARNESILAKLGAQFMDLNHGSMHVARVSNDPTITTKGENDAWTATSVAFDSVLLHSHTLGAMIVTSNELLQDAPNAGEVIGQTLARALAVEMDRQGLYGTGSQQMLGVTRQTGVQSVAVGGAIDWDEILDGRKLLWNINAPLSGIATTPTLATALAKLKRNSEANHYASTPTMIGDAPFTISNQIDAGECLLGDWSQVVVGIRQQAVVEFSQNAGDTFAKNQTAIRVRWRGDVGLLRPNHLVRLTGLTA